MSAINSTPVANNIVADTSVAKNASLHPSSAVAAVHHPPPPLDFESLKVKLEKLMTSGPAADVDKKSAAVHKDLKGTVVIDSESGGFSEKEVWQWKFFGRGNSVKEWCVVVRIHNVQCLLISISMVCTIA